ncbi:MAG: S9 family peptidase [Lachnospiraceae bacterium]|nr:S9 family peptidase [Lachnospiraceae bacterium]
MAEKRKSSFEDFKKKETISFGEYNPLTDEILYADSRYDEENGKRVSQIVLQARTDANNFDRRDSRQDNAQSGGQDSEQDCRPDSVQDGRQNGIQVSGQNRRQKRITAGGHGETNPVFSPDYTKILFLSAVEKAGTQLFVCDLDTESCRQLTTMRFGLMNPIWSPDGKWIAFTSFSSGDMDEEWLQQIPDPDEEAAYARERAKEPVVITDFGYKFDGLGFAQPEVMQLWVVPSDGSAKARRITSENANFMHAGWAPDSRHILCESNLYCDKEISIAMDVLLIDVDTCVITRVTKDQMVVSYPNPVTPVFTPDGKYIIVGILDYPEKPTGTYPSCSLYRITPDGQEQVRIFEKTEECFDSVQFPYNAGCGRGLEKMRISSDGCSVLFHSGSFGAGTIWKVPIYGENHRPEKLAGGKAAYNGMGVPHNGKVLVTKTETDRPEAYYLMDEKDGRMELLVQSNEAWLQDVALSRAEDFFFDTLDGESRVHGFALPPQGMEAGKKYPCICYIHGGPHPFYTYGFDLEMQCFAGEGFGVIFCNPRGSSGYGDVHRNQDRAFDGSAYMDILQFVSEACSRFSWIDSDRIGLTGGSYGGYMTNYIATRSNRFRAYITQRSVVNNLIDYASSDMQGSSEGYPTFGEFMVHEIEKSPICGMEKVSAPFLILHGMEDYRCPVEGAHQLFVALKDSHAEDFPIKMVLYPHCGHEQPSDPDQLQHYYRTMADWFHRYL